jgi:HEAT repeat protein
LDDNDAFGLITGLFDDAAADVRNAAARALYEFKHDRAASFTRALREGSAQRRRNIAAALNHSGLAAAAIDSLAGESREKTYDAFSLLFLMAKAGEVQTLLETIEKHPDIAVRLSVIRLLTFSNQPDIIPAFRSLAVRGSLPTEVRSAVMEAIYQISSNARDNSLSAA